MSYFLFVDESGQDRKASPYEVLAGVSVLDRELGRLSREAHDLEVKHFGRRYSLGTSELKGRNLLKKKVFQHAGLNVRVSPEEIPVLAKSALDDGAAASVKEWKGLALAKLAYVRDALDLCIKLECKASASVVETDSPATTTDGLRKDYAYLFERFFYFLEDLRYHHQGVVIFDELDKSKSHVLIDQLYKYFRTTAVGQQRASLIVPEPFFVHSDLTTGVQFADLLAYIISWAWRNNRMLKPVRPELSDYASQAVQMRFDAHRPKGSQQDFTVFGFAHITDLRTNLERFAEAGMSSEG